MNRRIDLLRTEMAAAGIGAFFTCFEVNIQYLTGFTGEDAGLYVSRDEVRLIVDSRFKEQAAESVPGFPLLPRNGEYGKMADELSSAAGVREIGLEADRMCHRDFSRFSGLFKADSVRPLEGFVEKLRMRKDAGEVALIGKACSVAMDALDDVRRSLRPGVTEKDAADMMEAAIRRRGGAKSAFDMSVLAKKRSAQPHGRPSDAALADGDILLIDFGALVDSYMSDLTRVLFINRIDPFWKEVFDVVLTAQARAIEAALPGKPLSDVDRAAREYIESRGFGSAFTHAVGHGVGREIHERPAVGARSRDLMEPGMVFTVEPGLYFADRGGVRIEDMVVIEERGARALSRRETGFERAVVRAGG